MKKLISAIKLAYFAYKNPGALMLAQMLLDFVNKVSEEEKAMMCKIGLFNTGTGERVSDFVTLWAGIGEADVYKRLEHVLHQRNELKRMIASSELPKEVKDLVENFFV